MRFWNCRPRTQLPHTWSDSSMEDAHGMNKTTILRLHSSTWLLNFICKIRVYIVTTGPCVRRPFFLLWVLEVLLGVTQSDLKGFEVTVPAFASLSW